MTVLAALAVGVFLGALGAAIWALSVIVPLSEERDTLRASIEEWSAAESSVDATLAPRTQEQWYRLQRAGRALHELAAGAHRCPACGEWCLCAEFPDGDPCHHCDPPPLYSH